MLHGFAGSGIMFYKLIGQLQQYFQITTIDLLGMGCSGRPSYNSDKISTPERAIAYFVMSIKAWML